MKTSKISILFITILLLSSISCKKDYLDINTNPNDPAVVPVSLVLPSAELAIGSAMGNNFYIIGGLYCQFYTQSPSASQFKTFEQYNPGAEKFDWPWRVLYVDALQNLNFIVEKGTELGYTQYVAVAKLLQAYSYQVLTDNFGDIPYSEANRGREGIFAPHYDNQQSIYNGIIQTLNEGIALIDESVTSNVPGTDDVLFNGDMSMWRKFGNTLKLKMHLRLSEVDPTKAQAGIATFDASTEFFAPGENAKIDYTTDAGNTHPYFSFVVGVGGTQNLVASNTAIDYLINNNDSSRIQVFYDPSPNGSIQGIPQGAYNLPASTPVSEPGVISGVYDNSDVFLISDHESLFLQAEAVERGWLTSSSSAQSLYESGITASFAATGFTGGEDVTYYSQTAIAYPAGGTFADKLERIITEKWIAMCGTQGDEAWIEWRRTNYPDFFTQSANNIMGSTVWPYRLFYPSTEVTRNVNFPGQKTINSKVWWDAN